MPRANWTSRKRCVSGSSVRLARGCSCTCSVRDAAAPRGSRPDSDSSREDGAPASNLAARSREPGQPARASIHVLPLRGGARSQPPSRTTKPLKRCSDPAKLRPRPPSPLPFLLPLLLLFLEFFSSPHEHRPVSASSLWDQCSAPRRALLLLATGGRPN